MRRTLTFLITLLLVTATALSVALAQECSGSCLDADWPSSDPAIAQSAGAAVPDGWRVYKQSADGYQIALPPSWRRIDLDPDTVSSSVSAAEETDPRLGSWLTNQVADLIASHVRFFAFDFNPASLGSGFLTNVNIISEPLPGASIPLDLVAQISVAQLENLPSVNAPVKHQRVSLPAGLAEELDYTITIGDRTVATSQYVLVSKTRTYVLTFSSKPEQLDENAIEFADIAQTFVIVD